MARGVWDVYSWEGEGSGEVSNVGGSCVGVAGRGASAAGRQLLWGEEGGLDFGGCRLRIFQIFIFLYKTPKRRRFDASVKSIKKIK